VEKSVNAQAQAYRSEIGVGVDVLDGRLPEAENAKVWIKRELEPSNQRYTRSLLAADASSLVR
jgi:hypothetical protein